jgi:hypothetical protein
MFAILSNHHATLHILNSHAASPRRDPRRNLPWRLCWESRRIFGWGLGRRFGWGLGRGIGWSFRGWLGGRCRGWFRGWFRRGLGGWCRRRFRGWLRGRRCRWWLGRGFGPHRGELTFTLVVRVLEGSWALDFPLHLRVVAAPDSPGNTRGVDAPLLDARNGPSHPAVAVSPWGRRLAELRGLREHRIDVAILASMR